MPFAAYPSAVVYKTPGDKSKRNAATHLIWGDWVKILGPREGDWVKVYARRKYGWIHKKDLQENQLLELDFVDIGQGDSCLVTTPEGGRFLVDAGEGDNLYRFLRWRFDRFKEPLILESAIISHPDKDHFGGLKPLVDEKKISFGTIFHNGIVERSGRNSFGTVIKQGKTKYLADVIEYKYIPVRRLALHIEESLYRGTHWAVFEPNEEPLWAQIRLNVSVFMNNLFRQGAFQGSTPHDAYFVKCDKGTKTQGDINNGIVNIIVGFAPLKPAEFVIIKIQQLAGQMKA